MQAYYEAKGVTLFQGDCLEVMRHIPDASIDACITDPPYGTTACSWDAVIPFAPMWAELKRIVKRNGAIVLFGSQPFTSALVMSNPQMFKYQWIWKKSCGAGFLNAQNAPIKMHEDVVVFSKGTTANLSDNNMIYNPQGTRAVNKPRNRTGEYSSAVGSRPSRSTAYVQTVENYPTSILSFANDVDITHDTAKPLALLRYLVLTYTNEGDTVLDFTCGSGTTGVACAIERRGFIGIEQAAHYCEVSEARIKRAQGIACDIPKRVKQYAPTPLFEAVA